MGVEIENKQYLGSDIKFKYVPKLSGELVQIGSMAFLLEFFNPIDRIYVVNASFDGTTYSDNVVDKTDYYAICLNNPKFKKGQLYCRETLRVPDADFKDGVRDFTVTYQVGDIIELATGIALVGVSEIGANHNVTVVGEPGKPAIIQGGYFYVFKNTTNKYENSGIRADWSEAEGQRDAQEHTRKMNEQARIRDEVFRKNWFTSQIELSNDSISNCNTATINANNATAAANTAATNANNAASLINNGNFPASKIITDVTGASISQEDFNKMLLENANLYYGVEWLSTDANSAVKRIGNPLYHQSLPIQSKMRGCLLKDDGKVNYYLNANDWNKKEDGIESKLDGTDGQVMVEIPEHYRKIEVITENSIVKCRVLLSTVSLPDFIKVNKVYRSAYEASIDRTITATPKLCSVINKTTSFRGGDNTASWDGTYRSLLGMPATNTNLTNFRKYARNRGNIGLNGAGWNCDLYDVQKTCYWLYLVEYANRNCQLDFNAELDANGFKQGGLGLGVTDFHTPTLFAYNAYNPTVPCGYTDSLGNNTGIVPFTMPIEYGNLTMNVPRYRGLENPFGHMWSWTDGCKVSTLEEGNISTFYTCNDPSKFNDDNYEYYNPIGIIPRVQGFVKEMTINKNGDFIPSTVGAGSTTYYTDAFYTELTVPTGEYSRGVMFGGYQDYRGYGGLTTILTSYPLSYVRTFIGTRLCFLPNN